MKRFATALMLLVFAALLAAPAVFADETKAIAVIQKIDLAADGKSAMVTIIENKTDKTLEVLVKDDLTLDKFKDHRIQKGDEIRLKYTGDNGKNVSTYFRKTAGC